MPSDVFPREPAPEPGQVFLGFGTERLVAFDAGNVGLPYEVRTRGKYPSFM